MANLKLTSSSFDDGGAIPSAYTCDGDGRSPELNWSNVPEEAESLALVMDDPDAPGQTFTHWLVINIPAESGELPEGVAPEEALEPGSPPPAQGQNDFGEIDYGPPCPPPGDDPHNYSFRLYALDTHLDLSEGFSKDELERAVEDHVIEQAEISASYRRGG